MKKRLFTGVIFSFSLFLLLLGGINLPQLNNFEEPIDSSPPSEERLEYIENEWLLQVESYEEALEIALDSGLLLKSVSDYGIAVFYGDLNNSSQPLYYKEKVDFQRNYLYYTQEVVINDPEAPSQFALDHLDAYNAWSYSLGDGVLVAVIDTGIESTHDEFQGNISPLSYNSSSQNVGIEFVGDDVGHGTMVAGVIAATQNNSIGISGIAPEADLMVIKANIDNEGMFSGDSIAEAIYYATDSGADIINMSLGGSYADPIVEAACDYAYNAGVIVVAAAGNDGLPILNYPASFSSVISVGATTSIKEKAQFSNYNRFVDISAPGQDIYTTIMGNTYGGVSGTSFSSPYVAGVIALLKSYYLAESNDMILSYLYASTEDLGTFGKDSLFGYGLANAHDAMTITLRQVTLDTGLGSPIDPKYVAEGRPFYINDRPLLDGHYFAGWYKDATLLERFDFANEVIYTDITLYAKYEVGESTFPDDYEFLVNSDDTVTILSYFGPGGVVSVPNEIYGLPVVEISGGAFIFNNNVTELVIPDSVVSIGDYAFAYMDGVISITVGAGVVNLGEAVFGACPTLTSVEITSTLFSYLPDHSFESSTSLTSVILPSTITELGRNAFYNTISLQNFTFPASLKIIGNNAFGNSGIQSAILPEGLEHIHSSAFSYAFNLNTIYFGESLMTIGNQAFLGCQAIENVTISASNPQFTIFMDVLYTKDYSTLVWYLPYNSLETFTMPNNVYHLASSAFSNARFEYFVFNSVVTEIPETAFYEAENLKEIVIPDNVKTIGVEAFKRAYALESVVFPKDLEKIPAGMFDRCIALKNVVFPENLKIVGASAFVSSGVEKIILPETVETLEGWAFHACYFLKEIYVPDGIEYIGDIALSTAPIEQIYPNVEFIGISGIPIANMEEIIYPASLTVLSKQTTDGYHSLTRKIDFGSAKDIYLDLKQGSKVHELVINAATETFLLEGLSLYKIHTYFYGMNTTISMPISDMMVIHAYEGSSAHQFAIDNGLTFYSLTRDVINHNVTININGPATVIDGYPALVQDQELLHFKLDVAENNMVYSVKANGKYLTNANRSYWVNVVEDLVIDIVIKPNDYVLEYSNFTVIDQEVVQTLTNAERINYPSVDEFDNQIIGLKELDGRFVINSELYNSQFGSLYNSAYDVLHISFPEHVTHIPFLDNIYGSLETVDIPEGVSTMSGFEGLGKLKYLVLPSTLSEFPHWIDT
ncbi:MAG: leucine-rich repeat protein, partial [Candidatus Izemoplasmatales bacterium]|nr:leucine-rich repeat protein [Candidatus Izemoplasmatales bacterium]